MSSKAHISFAKYLDEEKDIGQMSDIMHRFIQIVEFEINQTKSFEMKIEGFDFFTHGSDYQTIYAALQLSDEFMTWFNNNNCLKKKTSSRTLQSVKGYLMDLLQPCGHVFRS